MGYKHTQEAKDKISKAMKGRFISKETREKLSIANKGKKISDEAKQKMSLAKKGFIPHNKGKKTNFIPSSAFKKGSIPWNKGKTSVYSEERILKMREIGLSRFSIKENHPRYKKDRNSLVKSEYKHLDSEYQQWAKSVKNRDGWKCRIADNNCDGKLEAHHILPWRDFVELRYEINNGITLCHAHHPRCRAEEKRLVPTFQELVSVSK